MWGRDDEGKDDRRLGIASREPGEPLLPAHDRPPVPHYGAEPLAEAAQLVGFAMIERHGLCVLPEADKAEAEVSLVPLLVKVQPDEREADPVGEPRSEDGVYESGPDHIAGHGNGRATQRHTERSREPPEDRDDTEQRHRCPQAADAESERAGHE